MSQFFGYLRQIDCRWQRATIVEDDQTHVPQGKIGGKKPNRSAGWFSTLGRLPVGVRSLTRAFPIGQLSA
jgi:hypothetical protein